MPADGWRCGGVRKESAGRRDGAGLWHTGSLKNEKNYWVVDYTIWTMNRGTVSKFDELPTAYALLLKKSVGADGFPGATCWEQASAIRFERDWRGEQADPQRATEVRLLWNAQTLFLRFFARYRELHVFQDARADGWRDELWERDVAEAFLSLAPAFDRKRSWRANFFRVEGKVEPRFYSAWNPTMTPAPNFHVPEAFGHLVFRES